MRLRFPIEARYGLVRDRDAHVFKAEPDVHVCSSSSAGRGKVDSRRIDAEIEPLNRGGLIIIYRFDVTHLLGVNLKHGTISSNSSRILLPCI